MKKKMEIKKLIGNNAYWTINKSLAKELGLEATLLLQHLIDLEENYFEGEFWQTGSSLQESTFLSKFKVSKALKLLENISYIEVENKVPNNSKTISKVYHFKILKENISKLFNQHQSNSLTSVSKEIEPTSVKQVNRVDKEKLDKEKTNINKLDKNNIDKVLDVLVAKYPGNIGSHKVIKKSLKELSKAELILTIKNLDRYTESWTGYFHNLRNYIEQRHFIDRELEKRETKNIDTTKYKSDGSTVNTQYIDKF